MDYEKLYREANKKVAVRFGSNVAKELFPDLYDSKDERIRKALITFFQKFPYGSIGDAGTNVNEAIAWLEKQREYKPKVKTQFVYLKFRVGDVISPNEEDGKCDYTIVGFNEHLGDYLVDGGNIPSCSIGIEFIDAKFHLKDRGMWSKKDKEMLSACIRIFERISDGDLIKGNKDDANKYISFLKSLRPQKQQHDDEWSDEDKEFLKWTLSNLAELKDRYGEDYGKVGKCIDWLNSLQPQPIDVEAAIAYQEGYQKAVVEFSQKQQEWTDEDINMIDWLIRCCEKEHEELCNDRYGHQEIVSDLKRDCRKKWDWLESLKGKVAPQKQWKPSEKQMKAVEEALSLAKNCGEEYSFDLRKLLEQLKAL